MLPSILLAFLSGILYVFSFAPWDQSYLQWIAFLPLFYAVERLPVEKRTIKNLFGLGFIFSFLICFGGFYWMVYATENYGGLPKFAAVLLFLAFCITGQLQVPFYLILRERFRAFPLLLLSLLYVGIESFYPKLFLDTAGHAFYNAPIVRQIADIGGPFFITWVILFVNELILSLILTKKLKYALSLFFVAVSVFGYGKYRNSEFEKLKQTNASAPQFRFSLIQANIGDFIKVAAERGQADAIQQVMGQYTNLSNQAANANPTPDALIWPETAYPAIFERPMSPNELIMDHAMRDFTKELKPMLIFGGYDIDSQALEYNSMFFYDAKTKTKNVYHKAILLMFGETLPFADSFPEMKSWFPTMGFFGRGHGPEVMTVKNGSGHEFKVAPSICYEDLLTDHSVEGAKLGADALLNITNDSWFGPDGEPYLHLALARFRSIETRLPLIRSTNTGFSVDIDPSGEMLKSTSLFKAETLSGSFTNRIMPEPPYLRLARLLGPNWFVRFAICFLAGTLLLLIKRNYKFATK